MDCVNHIGTVATAFCQHCGKAICPSCTRVMPTGQVLCEPCAAPWQQYQQPFAPPGGPNPSAAAVLGLIPGVGAMYNGQFFKGLIHVVIFAVLISITANYNGLFGIFIAAWILYQSFEAFHTAKALRDGLPPPDPLGLNEVGSWLNLGMRPRQQPGTHSQPGPGQQSGAPGSGPAPGAYPPPPYSSYQAPYPGTPYQDPPYRDPSYQGPPYQGPDPEIPPAPPSHWRRSEPVGAIVLIALGLLFLLGQLDIFGGRIFDFTWPIVLIGLGVWLIVRRVADSQGGPR